jgi:hypothetical protein
MKEVSDDGSSASEIDRIKSRIDGILTDSFGRGEAAYYLSRLGALLGADRAILEKLTGVKLASFVRDNFEYEIGSEGVHNNILFIKSKPSAGPNETLPTSTPRYQPRFWAAFAVPLPEGERRFINLQTMRFGSSREDQEVEGAQVREIEARFIAPAATSGRASETVDRINLWLNEQGLDSAPYLIVRKSLRKDGRTLLDMVVAALGEEQLKRVQLPLDIIRTLKDHMI